MRKEVPADAQARRRDHRWPRPSLTWAAGAMLLSSLLLAGAGCGGPTETRDDRFTVGPSPRLVVRSFNPNPPKDVLGDSP